MTFDATLNGVLYENGNPVFIDIVVMTKRHILRNIIIMIKEKIKRIEDKINTICDGDISYIDSKQFKYISKDFKDGLSINNMATGLKDMFEEEIVKALDW